MTSSSSLPEKLVPSINFAMVCAGVYRSGYPTKKNYPFLRALRLRSILYLCPEDYAESNLKFCEEENINLLRFPTEGNKEPFNDISEPLMHRILSAVSDTRNLPLLIHCNKGKHRTGTVVACLRLLQGWSLVSIFEEYKRFAGDKARVGDQQYVELYRPIVKLSPPFTAAWLCFTPRISVVYSEKELQDEEARQLGYSLLAPEVNPAAAPRKGAAPLSQPSPAPPPLPPQSQPQSQQLTSPPGSGAPPAAVHSHLTTPTMGSAGVPQLKSPLPAAKLSDGNGSEGLPKEHTSAKAHHNANESATGGSNSSSAAKPSARSTKSKK